MEHALEAETPRGVYSWSGGMCVVSHHSDLILDESTALKVDEDRLSICPEHKGTVLHLIPKDIAMMDSSSLSHWMSAEGSEGTLARAVVVPSNITALKHHIRWMFFRNDVAFRVFRNPQVAKGWLLDQWLTHQEDQSELAADFSSLD